MKNEELIELREEIKRRKDLYIAETKELESFTSYGSFIRGKAMAMLDILYLTNTSHMNKRKKALF